MSASLKEFRDFLLRGNLITLAVAFVMGLAFATLVSSFVTNLVMPIIAAIVGKPNFNDLTLGIGDGVIRYGSFITALINFVIVAFALFLVVKAFNTFRRKEEKEPEATEKDVLVEIRDLLAGVRERSGPPRPRATS